MGGHVRRRCPGNGPASVPGPAICLTVDPPHGRSPWRQAVTMRSCTGRLPGESRAGFGPPVGKALPVAGMFLSGMLCPAS